MRVLVASDRPLIRDYLVAAVADRFPEAGIDVATGLDACRTTSCHVAIVDLELTGSGLRSLCTHFRATGVAAIVTAESPHDALRLLRAGATGILAPTDGIDGVLTALDALSAGNTHVAPSLLGSILRGLLEPSVGDEEAGPRAERLSAREREVLALLGDGKDQTTIARALAISPQTAKSHLRHAMQKLGVRNRVEAAALASELGLTQEVDL